MNSNKMIIFKRIFFLFFIIIAISLSSYFFLLKPQKIKYLNIRKEFVKYKISLTKAEKEKSEINVIMNDINKLKRLLPINNKNKLSSLKYLPVLKEQLNKKASDLKLEISIKEGQVTPYDFHSEMAVELITKGEYHSLGSFILSLKDLPGIINISDIDITASDKNNKTPITAKIKGFIYLSNGSL